MSPATLERMAQLATQARLLQLIATLEGGFAALAQDERPSKWVDTLWPTPGEIRILPAASVQSTRLWRPATAEELMRWVASGCPDWRRNHPVFAIGSLYCDSEIPMVLPGDVNDGSVRLVTMPVFVKHRTPKARLKAVLQAHPQSFALCVIPRD